MEFRRIAHAATIDACGWPYDPLGALGEHLLGHLLGDISQVIAELDAVLARIGVYDLTSKIDTIPDSTLTFAR